MYNNSAPQIFHLRKEDSEFYICSGENLLGKAEKKTMLVVVSLPRFTYKPPSRIVSIPNCTVRLNCSATGDPHPIVSWRKQGGQLPIGRSQQINGVLVITSLQQSDAGNYICTATSAGVFTVEAVTALEIRDTKGVVILCIVYCERSLFSLFLFSRRLFHGQFFLLSKVKKANCTEKSAINNFTLWARKKADLLFYHWKENKRKTGWNEDQ